MNNWKETLKQLFLIPGVGSQKEKTTYVFLRFSAIALTIASGYTTFQGFTQYTPFFIALLLTIGVQGLLYSSSWKIGSAIKSHNLKFLKVVIFLFTMLTSVFFSYSSLLEVVYKKDLRLSDELTDKQNQVATAISSIKDSISNKINLSKTYDNFKAEFIVWNDTSSKDISKLYARLIETVDKNTSKQNAIEYALFTDRQNFQHNPDSLNLGYYNKSKSIQFNHRINRLFPSLAKYVRCKRLQFEHDSIFKAIIDNNRFITNSNISNLQQKKKELFPMLLDKKYSPRSIELPDTLKKQLIIISELNIFYDLVDSFKVQNYDNIRDLKVRSLNLIDKLPNSFKIDFSEIKNNLLDLDKYTGGNTGQPDHIQPV